MKLNLIRTLILTSATTISWFCPMMYQSQKAYGCFLGIGCKSHHHHHPYHPHHHSSHPHHSHPHKRKNHH